MWHFSRPRVLTSNAQKEWKIENLFAEIVLLRTLDKKNTKRSLLSSDSILLTDDIEDDDKNFIKINYFVLDELHNNYKKNDSKAKIN